MQKPLAGIRVAEFCSTAAGPFCAMLLAESRCAFFFAG